MRKIRIISLLLVLVLFMGMVGCKKPSENPIIETNNNYAVEYNSDKTLMLVSGYQSEYSIVVPENASEIITIAAQDLQKFIKLSTKCELPIINDSSVVADLSKKYISIGQTKLVFQSGQSADYTVVGDSGFNIMLNGNVVSLLGATDEGTLYAVYEFLNKEIGFEAYAIDEIYYNTLKDVPMFNFGTYVSVPAIQYRMPTYGHIRDVNDSRVLRLIGGQSNGTSVYGIDWGCASHSIEWLLPASKYQEEHPTWYGNGQICLSQDDLIDQLVENLKPYILNNPTARFFELGHGDTLQACDCKACSDSAAENGGIGGVYVRWLNKVGEKIEAWQKEIELDREIWIMGLAYQAYQYAPAIKNADGTFSPVNDSVVCRDNVSIRYAPIAACYAHAINDPNCKVNSHGAFADEIMKWSVCSKENLHLWIYCFEYYDRFFFFNDLGSLNNSYKFYSKAGVYGIKDEGSLGDDNNPFLSLRLYLRSKLMWNPELDVDVLIDDFYGHYFKEAAPHMRAYLDAIRAHFVELSIALDSSGCYGFNKIGAYYMDPANWEMNLLNRLQAHIDNAYEALEKANYDEQTYQRLRDRVRIDELFITHWYVSTYSSYFSNAEEIEANFYADCTRFGIYTGS